MMKKATGGCSIGQPWLSWQCPLWLQSRVWKYNPLLEPLSTGLVDARLEWNWVFANTLVHGHIFTQAIIFILTRQGFERLILNWSGVFLIRTSDWWLEETGLILALLSFYDCVSIIIFSSTLSPHHSLSYRSYMSTSRIPVICFL